MRTFDSLIVLKPNKYIENCFETTFEDVRHECLLPLLQSLTVLNVLKQSKFTEYELLSKKHSALDK